MHTQEFWLETVPKWIKTAKTLDKTVVSSSPKEKKELGSNRLTAARSFSLSSAYRWWHRLQQNQTHMRQSLCRICSPEPCPDNRPQLQLIQHLQRAFPQQPAEAFQLHFQHRFWFP